MNPVDKLAALRALAHGVNAAIPDLNAEVLEFRRQTRAKGFTSQFGEISFRRNPPKIKFFGNELLAWAQEHMPHEIIPEHTIVVPAAVRPSLLKTLEARFKIDGEDVIDPETGEVVPFAYVAPGDEDTVVFKQEQEQKDTAAALVAERIEAVTRAISEPLKLSPVCICATGEERICPRHRGAGFIEQQSA